MALDPIRANVAVAASAAAAVRVTSVRAQADKASPGAARPAQPILTPVPESMDEVKVKWDRSDGVIVTFTDKKSGDIVRQIPSEQVLSVARFIRQLLDEKKSGTRSEAKTGSDGNG